MIKRFFVPGGEDLRLPSRMQDGEPSISAALSTTKPENHVRENKHFLHASLEPPNMVTFLRHSIEYRYPPMWLLASANIVDEETVDVEEIGISNQRGHPRGAHCSAPKTSEGTRDVVMNLKRKAKTLSDHP